MRRLPAEWEKQKAVLLAMPHKDSDWTDVLDIVKTTYMEIIKEIAKREEVWLITDEPVNIENVKSINLPTNDTWARDFGAITVIENGIKEYLDFVFNGWGMKFASNFDNQINQKLYIEGILDRKPKRVGLVLEGGSIESDGNGTILTTKECLLEANRNPHLSFEEIEKELLNLFGAKRVLWLENGYLSGDDTDSHIDTLARLAPNDTILYVTTDDESDEHFVALKEMERELQAFRTLDDRPYNLIPLPMTSPIYDIDYRLPATYANFLIINGAVLLPIYNDKNDNIAISQLQKAFPERDIIPIDCNSLILQHGSLHCITMQFFEL